MVLLYLPIYRRTKRDVEIENRWRSVINRGDDGQNGIFCGDGQTRSTLRDSIIESMRGKDIPRGLGLTMVVDAYGSSL